MANFYCLMIVNHSTREFNTRIEEERGDVGSIHSFTCYLAAMARQITKAKLGSVKPHWMMPFWERVVGDAANCEQVVLARFEAIDIKAARAIWRSSHRDAHKHFYKGLGYTSFYPTAGVVQDMDQVSEAVTG